MSIRAPRPWASRGFSLIELLLVLAILGIVSAIAIPTYIGQRRRARVIGDAMSNAQVLRMGLEARRAEVGVYGAEGTYVWKADGTATSGPGLVPAFNPGGSSKMDYSVAVDAGGVTYTLTVNAPEYSNAVAFQTNQTGAELARLK